MESWHANGFSDRDPIRTSANKGVLTVEEISPPETAFLKLHSRPAGKIRFSTRTAPLILMARRELTYFIAAWRTT